MRLPRFPRAACALLCLAAPAAANDFSTYAVVRSYTLPAGTDAFDLLADGRVVALVSNEIFFEDAPAAGTFTSQGTLFGSPPLAFPAFLEVSPSGERLAIGTGEGVVGVVPLDLSVSSWFAAGGFLAAWADETTLALTDADSTTSTGFVTLLDTTSDPLSPTNPRVIDGIGGFSAGVAFDADGTLYTGNGFAVAGPSGTGEVRAFSSAAWQAARAGGPALDFETQGEPVVDLLSASSLGFDAAGNLHIGGGDTFGSGEDDFFGLVHADAVAAAAAGGGEVDANDPAVRRIDPDGTANMSTYSVHWDAASGDLHARDFGVDTVWVLDGTPLPSTYCTALPNSVGPGSSIGWQGTPSLAANDLVLTSAGNPPGTIGVFFYGAGQTEVPFGDGHLCVAGAMTRLGPPQPVSAAGTVARPLDFTVAPLGAGPNAVFAGDQRNFQFWYRNPAGGPAGFNLSDGLSVTFCP